MTTPGNTGATPRLASALQAAAGKDNVQVPWWRSTPWRALCWLVLAGSLMALAAPWLSVYVWLGFDVFSHFAPHFAALAVAAALCLWWPRRGPWLAALLLLAVPAALVAMSLLHRMPEAAGPPPATAVRLMSFNTWRGNDNLDAIEREIRQRRPDIAGLIEFTSAKSPLLPRLKDLYPHQVTCLHKPRCSLALLSRWPIVRVRSASLWAGPPYLHATVRTPSGPLHVFVVHTLRFPWLGSQLKQMRAMARIIHHVKKGRRIVVMGDFNATPFSRMTSIFSRNAGLRRLTWLPTWPMHPLPLPQLAIDHMFVSSGLRVLKGPWVGRAAGSDHLPVVVELGMVE